MLDLYTNIKKRRMELGLTQDDLAKLCGYTDRSSIAKIESGKIDLTQSKILLFAEVLRTTPAELMGWNEPEDDGYYTNPDTAAIAQMMKDNKEMSMLFDAARDADPEDLMAVYDMLLALKRKERRE